MDHCLEELAASGLSTAAFARERGIEPWRLYGALRRRSGKVSRCVRRKALEGFVPVRIRDGDSNWRSAKTLELVLSDAYRVVMSADFDEVALRRLLVVLRTSRRSPLS